MKTRLGWMLILVPIALVLSGCPSIRNESLYVEGGSTHDIGEVFNDSDSAYHVTQVTGTYYDAAGNVIATKSTVGCPEVVSPHDAVPFDVTVGDGSQVAQHSLAIQGENVPSPLSNHLALRSTHVSRNAIGIEVNGRVANEGSVPYYFVEVCLAFYDGNGTLVRTGWTLVGLGDLAAGEAGSFDMYAIGVPSQAASVRLWLDASETDSLEPVNPVMPISTGPMALPR